MKDFEPESVAKQIPQLRALMAIIAQPHMQPGMINVEQKGISPDRLLRYREEWVTLQVAFGSEEESMAIAQFNFTIRFAHESNDSWKVCPVARIIRDEQNAWRLDPSFIPPVASFAASPILCERLVLLNRQLRSRRQRLMTMRRESNERLAQYFALDMESHAAHEIQEQGVCMFYVPEMLGAPELELFAVLRS